MNESMNDEMAHPAKEGEFVLPLELQFSMRKAEIGAKEMTWEQLYSALLNLYYQRLMEWHAVKALIAQENIEIEFDIPTDLELQRLAEDVQHMNEREEEDPFEPV